jgi:hypothetical protein
MKTIADHPTGSCELELLIQGVVGHEVIEVLDVIQGKPEQRRNQPTAVNSPTMSALCLRFRLAMLDFSMRTGAQAWVYGRTRAHLQC